MTDKRVQINMSSPQVNRSNKPMIIRANHVNTGKHKKTPRELAFMKRLGIT